MKEQMLQLEQLLLVDKLNLNNLEMHCRQHQVQYMENQ
jgi:phage terminase small subunit